MTITTGLPVQLLRDERERRRFPVDDDRHRLVRRLGDPVASTMVGPTLLAFAIIPLEGGSAR